MRRRKRYRVGEFHQRIVLPDRVEANGTAVTHDLVDHVADGLRHVRCCPRVHFKVFDRQHAIVATRTTWPGHLSLSVVQNAK